MNPENFFDQYLEDPEPSFRIELRNKLNAMDDEVNLNLRSTRQQFSIFPPVRQWKFAPVAIILIIGAVFLFTNQSLAQIFERFVGNIPFVQPEKFPEDGYKVNDEGHFLDLPDDLQQAYDEAQSIISFRNPTYMSDGFTLDEVKIQKFRVLNSADATNQIVTLEWRSSADQLISLSIFDEVNEVPILVEDVGSIGSVKIQETEVAVQRGYWTTLDDEDIYVPDGMLTYYWTQDDYSYSLWGNDQSLSEDEAIKIIQSIISQK